jgi:DNA repair protein RadA/Sms
MAKRTHQYVCQSCGTSHARWAGKCDDCGAWDTLVEESVVTAPKSIAVTKGKGLVFTALSQANEARPSRMATGIGELDRVLGGGLVEGSAVLIGGDPGIGKSTLLLQAAAHLSAAGHKIAYISGEESTGQISLRAERLDVKAPNLSLAAATNVREILGAIDIPDAPKLVIIDSIQTMFIDSIDSAPGTVAQVRASAHALITAAKKRAVSLILVGHVTKDGQIAGPRVVEHMVDTVLYFEGERGHAYRILRAVKNRFGATDEIGVFHMEERGLTEVANPSSLFLSAREAPVPGAVVFAGMEGSRPLLVEVQALLSPSVMSTPRRAVVGYDSARLAMILAVLEARGGARFSDKEVFLSIAGGMRITEPAADLAAAAALLSAIAEVPFPSGMVAFGEIGLTGEIRGVARMDARLKESQKLGFAKALMPRATGKSSEKNPSLETLGHVGELVAWFMGQGETKRYA